MGVRWQSPFNVLILLLFNLKLQQTNFLIPKMLQIFILHIIIIVLNLLIIEDFSLQFLFVSLVNHNCAVSFDVNIAITINKDAKHLAVITPQSGFSYQTNTKAHITNSASSVYNKTFTPNIAVIV